MKKTLKDLALSGTLKQIHPEERYELRLENDQTALIEGSRKPSKIRSAYDIICETLDMVPWKVIIPLGVTVGALVGYTAYQAHQNDKVLHPEKNAPAHYQSR